MRKQTAGGNKIVEDRLGHPVVDQRQQRCAILRRDFAAVDGCDAINPSALDAHDAIEAAVMRDIGCLRRPRRNRAWPWNRKEKRAIGRRTVNVRPVGQQPIKPVAFVFS